MFKEEVFGPVVAIMKFEDENKVISMANETNYGLAGGVWTQDISRAIRVASQVDAGYLWVNTYGGIIPETPYGGFKQSGLGKELGSEGLEEYLRVKNISIFKLAICFSSAEILRSFLFTGFPWVLSLIHI